MKISFWSQLLRRRPLWRFVPLALTLLIGWSSVEVLWDREEAPVADAVAVGAADSEGDASSEDDCHCLCACDCRAVHVVPTAVPQAPRMAEDLQPPELERPRMAPPGRSTEPPFHPPRYRA